MKKLLVAIGLSVLGVQIVFAQGTGWESFFEMDTVVQGDFRIYAERNDEGGITVTLNDTQTYGSKYFVDCNVYPSGDDRFAQSDGEDVVFANVNPKGVYVCSATAQPFDGWVRYSNRVSVIPSNVDSEGNFYEENPFSDVNVNTWEGKAAIDLYHRGVVSGNPDGSFDGMRKVNRVEAAKMLILAYAQHANLMSPDGKIGFDDVDGLAWYFPVVIDAVNMGFMDGYNDDIFGPEREIKTAEFLKMMVELYGLETGLQHDYEDVPEGIWYEKYVGAAKKYDLLPKRIDRLEPGRILTRDEVAVAIHRYLLFRNGDQK